MAYMNNYKWNTPVRCGKLTKWISILKFINEHGPSTKREILKNVFGVTHALKCTWNSKTHKYDKEYFPIETASSKCNLLNGNRSHLFSCMNEDNLICYNKSTYKWSLTYNGKMYLERYNMV